MSESDNPRSTTTPPEPLTDGMRQAVEGNLNPSADQLLAAADKLLAKVLATNCESRASALDLLTVDALLTHSMELASGDAAEIERISEQAMRVIASHADRDSQTR